MISKIKNIAIILFLLLFTMACNKGPKVVKSTVDTNNTEKSKSSGIFSNESSSQESSTPTNSFGDDMHSVKVNEILKTSKYLYLNVTENNEQFWIATRIMDVTIGETYYFKGGLLKTNYENKEFDRVFEKIYLVSGSLVAANHSSSSNNSIKTKTTKQQVVTTPPVKAKSISKKIEVKGSIKISDLVKNPKKYEGKTIQVSGVCVKSNANIMKRHWIHLKDGSKDDYDLVITSDTFIPEGSVITMKATVSLNKDFGAGYKYDLILENGIIVN